MPLSFCLEFIIVAIWKRLAGGVKVCLFVCFKENPQIICCWGGSDGGCQ